MNGVIEKDGVKYSIVDPITLDWSKAPTKWRGGYVSARWAKDGEKVKKADGTDIVASAGDVAILGADGTVRYTISGHLAAASYNIGNLPKDKTDMTVVTLNRNPEEVRVFEITEPSAIQSTFPEDKGAWRTLNVGDLIEYAPGAREAAVRPIWKDGIAARYLAEPPESARSVG